MGWGGWGFIEAPSILSYGCHFMVLAQFTHPFVHTQGPPTLPLSPSPSPLPHPQAELSSRFQELAGEERRARLEAQKAAAEASSALEAAMRRVLELESTLTKTREEARSQADARRAARNELSQQSAQAALAEAAAGATMRAQLEGERAQHEDEMARALGERNELGRELGATRAQVADLEGRLAEGAAVLEALEAKVGVRCAVLACC
jgi:hypothetical protein